jgi:molybdenum-dependent DNA-binding transcriptional regulator ModE
MGETWGEIHLLEADMAELPIVERLRGRKDGDVALTCREVMEAAELIEKLYEALEPYVRESAEALRREEGWRTEVSEQLDDDADVGDYWALSIRVKDIRKGIAALALAKGEK